MSGASALHSLTYTDHNRGLPVSDMSACVLRLIDDLPMSIHEYINANVALFGVAQDFTSDLTTMKYF